MKHTKRFASLLLVLVMALSLMAVPAMAAGTGTITINNAVPGETYKIYQIFTLESYDPAVGAYAYKIDMTNSPWKNFFDSTQDGAGASYVTIDEQGYVTWKSEKDNAADRAAFAKAALLYAQDNEKTIEATQTKTAGGDGKTTTVEFTGLELGYYLVDSSLGTLAILGSTDTSFEGAEKNEVPNVDKKVQEDSNNTWGDSNDADIGQEVTFQTTITVRGGARKYVLHDEMTGLTFKEVTSVQYKEAESYDADTDTYKYKAPVPVKNTTNETNYTVTKDTSDGCSFEVSFDQSFLNILDTGDQIVVTYTATVNTDAVVGGNGNPNKTNLTYGDNQRTEDDTTTTYTYSFDLVKTKSDKTVLNGAEFKLYDAETGGNEIALVKESNGVYRVATPAEKGDNGFTSAVIEAGKATIKGLDSGTYWLEETKQPTGYNKLDGRQKVEIKSGNLDAVVSDDTYDNGGVQVINYTGSQLPTTGGMGTTIFYVLGGALMLGAVVLLITKKRMGQTEK